MSGVRQSNAMQRHVSGKQCKELMIVAIVWNGSIQFYSGLTARRLSTRTFYL